MITRRVSVGLLRCALLMGIAGVMRLLTACTVGPDYVRPTTEAPDSYKETAGWKMAEPKDRLIRGAWWEIYNDPELNALEGQVNLSNQNIAQAEAQFRQAQALVRVARAAYFPTVTTSPAFSRSLSSSNTGGSTGASTTGSSSKSSSQTSTGTTPVSNFLLPVSASWELDVWGKVRRTVEASAASAQSSAANIEAIRLLMQTELAQDYFQLRSLDAQKQLLDATVTAYQKSLDLTKNRYASGIASKGDVLQAEAQLKSTQAQAIDIELQRAQMEHAIALIVGKPASTFSIPVVPLAAVPPSIPIGLPSELLEQRPDIAAAERLMAAANAQIGVAIAAYYPTVTLSGSAGFQASSLSKWLTWPSRFWAVGATISEVVFEGGLRRAQTAQARAAYDAQVASYRQTVLTGFQEVEDNLAALRILEEENLVQDEAVQATREALAVTMNQYKSGIVSYLNVLVAQVLALSNERTAIDIQGRRMIASVLLVKALGGGWNASALQQSVEPGGSDESNPQSTENNPEPANQGSADYLPGHVR